MSISLTQFIKHDFHDIKDKQASLEFVKKSIRRIQDVLGFEGEEIEPSVFEYEDILDIEFEVPEYYNLSLQLRNGFWEIWSACHHGQVFFHDNGYFWIRALTFDIARALGQDEAWYMDEYHSHDYVRCDIENEDFDKWLSVVTKEFNGTIPEFDVTHIMSHEEDYWRRVNDTVNHDSFAECKAQFEEIQDRLGDINLLGLLHFGDFYRCKKDGRLIFVHCDTLSPLEITESDMNRNRFPNGSFALVRDGLSALFSSSGKPLTRFVEGEFRWERISTSIFDHAIAIYNEEAEIRVICELRDDPST